MRPYDSDCCFRGSSVPDGVRVLWELNTSCNLACTWCHARPYRYTGLTTEEIRSGLNQVRRWGIEGVIFSGGEPLLRKDLIELVRAAFDLGFKVDLCTNGTLVDRDFANGIKAHVSEISVSLDSADPAVHDRLRGKTGAFERTVRGIRWLIQAGLDVHAITLCCDETCPDVENTLDFMATMGIHSVTLLGLVKVRGVEPSAALSPGVKAHLADALPSLRVKHPDIVINSKRILALGRPDHCGAGETMAGIDAGGNVLPCILLRDRVPSRPLIELSAMENWADVKTRLMAPDRTFSWRICQGGV